MVEKGGKEGSVIVERDESGGSGDSGEGRKWRKCDSGEGGSEGEVLVEV
jgi:hypothetical protein